MAGRAATRSGVLFDVDGTLVDTSYLHAVCWAEAMRQHGHVVPMAQVHHAIGMASEELLAHCLGEQRDTGEDDALSAAHLTMYQQHWGRLSPLPGAAELLRACAGRGLDVVLASSASEDELAAVKSALDADDAITTATSSSDADSGKPAPDILQVALDRSGLDRERVVSSATRYGTASRRSGPACGSSGSLAAGRPVPSSVGPARSRSGATPGTCSPMCTRAGSARSDSLGAPTC